MHGEGKGRNRIQGTDGELLTNKSYRLDPVIAEAIENAYPSFSEGTRDIVEWVYRQLNGVLPLPKGAILVIIKPKKDGMAVQQPPAH